MIIHICIYIFICVLVNSIGLLHWFGSIHSFELDRIDSINFKPCAQRLGAGLIRSSVRSPVSRCACMAWIESSQFDSSRICQSNWIKLKREELQFIFYMLDYLYVYLILLDSFTFSLTDSTRVIRSSWFDLIRFISSHACRDLEPALSVRPFVHQCIAVHGWNRLEPILFQSNEWIELNQIESKLLTIHIFLCLLIYKYI